MIDDGSTNAERNPAYHQLESYAGTDPEFVGYFASFAYSDVEHDAARLSETLAPSTRVMVQLAAVLAAGGSTQFADMARSALVDTMLSPVELKELIYQSVAYVGWARARDYLDVANSLLNETGVVLPLPGQSTSTPETRLDHGKRVQARLVDDDVVTARLEDTPADEVHFQRYLAANCFGDTVGRAGIEFEVRELLTFSMLVALGGADAQVRGHVTGNVRIGNTRAQLLAVLTLLVPYIGYPRTLNGLAAVNDLTR